MVSRRELARERARTQRALERQAAAQEASGRQARLEEILEIVRCILGDVAFKALAVSQGIRSVPSCLTCESGQTPRSSDHAESMMTFIVAWKFMSSILVDDEIREFVDARWPSFVTDLKDVFIGIVSNGPFPEERKRTLPSFQSSLS